MWKPCLQHDDHRTALHRKSHGHRLMPYVATNLRLSLHRAVSSDYVRLDPDLSGLLGVVDGKMLELFRRRHNGVRPTAFGRSLSRRTSYYHDCTRNVQAIYLAWLSTGSRSSEPYHLQARCIMNKTVTIVGGGPVVSKAHIYLRSLPGTKHS